MINKQSLWFVTLFSLILILGVYYITMPKDALTTFSGNLNDNSEVIEVTESDIIVALKVEAEEKILKQMEDAQKILLDATASVSDKNMAYETLQQLNSQKGKVLSIEELIKKEFKVDSCAEINGNNIIITLACADQGTEYANKVIKAVQKLYENQMYITIKFQK